MTLGDRRWDGADSRAHSSEPVLAPQSESVVAAVSRQLGYLEKRDAELWLILAIIGIVLAVGFGAVVYPTIFFRQGALRLEFTVSRELFFGLLVLLILGNIYVASRRLELRRVRSKLISATLQSELVRLQSFIDPLTEIYNRRSLDEMAGRFIASARRSREPLTFAIMDVDRFKQVNTKFGHLTGDFVLAEVAGLLRSSVRGSDAVVRYGGDEFLLILGGASRETAAPVIERIENFLDEWNSAGHLRNFKLSLSMGFAEWSEGRTVDEVLDAADQEMYAQKAGKN